jgi:hypothetical protein
MSRTLRSKPRHDAALISLPPVLTSLSPALTSLSPLSWMADTNHEQICYL